MNIYDKIVIKCVICKKSIGEISYDAKVIFPRCGDCADPKPHVEDHIYPLKRDYDFPDRQIINTLRS